MRASPEIPLRGDRNECPGCGKLFNSTFAFEKHRTGSHGFDRRCLTIEEMVDKGMAISARGFWLSSPYDKEWVAQPVLQGNQPTSDEVDTDVA